MDSGKLKRELVKFRNYGIQTECESMRIEELMLSEICKSLDIQTMEKSENNSLEEIFKKQYDKHDDGTNIEDLKKLKRDSDNYNISELILFFISHAHDDWVKRNELRLDLKKINDAYKFVPYELLGWDEVKKYYSILSPVLNALEIEHSEQEVRKDYELEQVIFLLNNGIYTNELLSEKLRNIEYIYPQILTVQCDDGKSLSDKLRSQHVLTQIYNQYTDRYSINIVEKLKKVIKNESRNIGFARIPDIQYRKGVYKLYQDLEKSKIGIKRNAMPRESRLINKAIFKLARDSGIVFVKNLNKYDYNYTDYSKHFVEKVCFKPFDNCSNEEKKQIEKRNKKLEKFINAVNKSTNKKYLETGLITLLTVDKEINSKNAKSEILQIEISKKELAELGILPEEVCWETKHKALINSSKNTQINSNGVIEKLGKSQYSEKKEFKHRIAVNINEIKQNHEKTQNKGIDKEEDKNR